MTRIIDSWTARDLIVELYGAFDDSGETLPGRACSEPIADEILAPAEDDRWYFDEVRAEECDCGHIGPRDNRNGNCCDCEVTLSEAEFSDRLGRLRTELRKSRVPRALLSRLRELLGVREKSIAEAETFERFVLRRLHRLRWRASVPWRKLWENPQALADHSEYAKVGGQRSDDRIRRDIALRMIHYTLDIPSYELRFFAPISGESLRDLPVAVSAEISSICRRFDRTTESSVRKATTAFRRACEPLGDYEVFHHDGYIGLKWNARVYCLINCEKDFANRKTSTQRSPGCCLMLLKETNEALQREIDYFREQVQRHLLVTLVTILKNCVKQMAGEGEDGQARKRGAGRSTPLGYKMIIYYARRFSRPNPYPRSKRHAFPEDRGPMLRHFGPSQP
jgi:hypothetical protein